MQEDDDGEAPGEEELGEEAERPAAASEPVDVISKPTSKAALQKLREQYSNTMQLVAHLYKDLTLRDDMRMVALAVGPFLEEYKRVLAEQKSQDW